VIIILWSVVETLLSIDGLCIHFCQTDTAQITTTCVVHSTHYSLWWTTEKSQDQEQDQPKIINTAHFDSLKMKVKISKQQHW